MIKLIPNVSLKKNTEVLKTFTKDGEIYNLERYIGRRRSNKKSVYTYLSRNNVFDSFDDNILYLTKKRNKLFGFIPLPDKVLQSKVYSGASYVDGTVSKTFEKRLFDNNATVRNIGKWGYIRKKASNVFVTEILNNGRLRHYSASGEKAPFYGTVTIGKLYDNSDIAYDSINYTNFENPVWHPFIKRLKRIVDNMNK